MTRNDVETYCLVWTNLMWTVHALSTPLLLPAPVLLISAWHKQPAPTVCTALVAAHASFTACFIVQHYAAAGASLAHLPVVASHQYAGARHGKAAILPPAGVAVT